MRNQNSKLAFGLAVLFEIIVIVTGIISITIRQWKDLTLSLLAIVSLTLPFLISRIAFTKNIVLPSSFQSVLLVFVFLAQYLGEIKKFYQIFWWWDLLLHALFGSYVVIIALYSLRGTFKKGKEVTKQRFSLFAIIFAFSFSITLGTLWELFEFVGDYLFKTNMVKGGLEDTSSDLLIKVLAAFITSIICYFSSLKKSNILA